ncbi:cyclic GMP-AMP synthase-like [Arapaima gigas]
MSSDVLPTSRAEWDEPADVTLRSVTFVSLSLLPRAPLFEISEMSGRGRARGARGTNPPAARATARAGSSPAARAKSPKKPPGSQQGAESRRGSSSRRRGRGKGCERPDGIATSVQPEVSSEPTSNQASSAGNRERAQRAQKESDPNKVLPSTLEKLKIKKASRSESTSIVNKVVADIKKFMKENSKHFKETETLRTGSAYENVKISKPDEFDVMFTIPMKRVRVEQFGNTGAFCSVHPERTDHPFVKDGTLLADDMLRDFREQVKLAVKDMQNVSVERKKKGCPAVTLGIKADTGFPISLDIVLGLEVHSSWPTFTEGGFKIEKWLGTKVKKEFKFKPFYLVPKYKGKGNEEKEGIRKKDVWCISFSHVEKGILKNHGQAKTCCEKSGVQCCRKACLKLLKHLLHVLKEKYPEELSGFSSYMAKTALLHACSTRVEDSNWANSNLSSCFQMLLDDFEKHLRSGSLPNFFIPSDNLLGCGHSQKSRELLADLIEKERNNGFPIFTS